ncbi:DUF6538 domain-containing protein [Methylobacterium ajmalii]|uniref:DUF6538 domain-containing protein n=1 Tax=Methylobacterium TaxID=407 RepID=UPI0038B2A8AE
MTYRVQDRHGTYYFRRIVPKALRPFMPAPWTGKSAWTKSLGTKEQGKAKQPFARCLSDCEADFALAERAMRGEPTEAPRSSPPMPRLRPRSWPVSSPRTSWSGRKGMHGGSSRPPRSGRNGLAWRS